MSFLKIDSKKLLEIPEVVQEIKRHLWLESEKAGRDIGFEAAADDWLKKYSLVWVQYHRPDLLKEKGKITPSKNNGSAKSSEGPKKRRAKSYSTI